MYDDEVSGQLVLGVVPFSAEGAGVHLLFLVNLLNVGNQEWLALEECLTSETLVLGTVDHLNHMFVNMDFELVISLVKFLVTNVANVDFVHTLRVGMVGEVFPHGLQAAKVDFAANLTGEGRRETGGAGDFLRLGDDSSICRGFLSYLDSFVLH